VVKKLNVCAFMAVTAQRGTLTMNEHTQKYIDIVTNLDIMKKKIRNK
jgi:hypothetical protein